MKCASGLYGKTEQSRLCGSSGVRSVLPNSNMPTITQTDKLELVFRKTDLAHYLIAIAMSRWVTFHHQGYTQIMAQSTPQLFF